MTVIQRWFFIGEHNDPYEFIEKEDAEFVTKQGLDMWCKAKDVEQLEQLIEKYLKDLGEARDSRIRAKADLSIADAKIRDLEAVLLVYEFGKEIEKL